MLAFAAKSAAARKLPRVDRDAAILALKLEKAALLRAIRERRAAERHATRLERQRRRPPHQPES
jgi:hypothetical protein